MALAGGGRDFEEQLMLRRRRALLQKQMLVRARLRGGKQVLLRGARGLLEEEMLLRGGFRGLLEKRGVAAVRRLRRLRRFGRRRHGEGRGREPEHDGAAEEQRGKCAPVHALTVSTAGVRLNVSFIGAGP